MKYIKEILMAAILLYKSWVLDRGFNKLRSKESKAEYIIRTTLLNPNKNKS